MRCADVAFSLHSSMLSAIYAREQREKPMYERATVKKSDAERFTLEENQ